MRINQTNPPILLSPARTPAADHAAHNRGRADRVEISLAARAAADSGKIGLLRAAFAAGTYGVPSDAIARSILNELQQP